MIKKHKIITYCIVGALAFSLHPTVAKADEVPIAGINLVLDNLFQNNEIKTINIEDYLSPELPDQYKDISFARVSNYVNIRAAANKKGKILGKLYNNNAATILEKSGDWYKIKSGTVTGYIKADYLITGVKAEKLAKQLGTRTAVVNTTTLKIREEASQDSSVLTLVPGDKVLPVEKELDGWIKVDLDGNKTGYVSTDYVKIRSEFDEAISIEEEKKKLAAEHAALQEASKARVQAQSLQASDNSDNASSSSNSGNTTIDQDSSNSSTIRNKIVQYALKFNGNPYVWGGTSLTNGTDCSGFTQSVYRDFGISIPRTSRTQAVSGRRISMNEIKPGDLIFYERYGTINHVGIYIGSGKVISASSPETGIRITDYNYRTPCKVVSYIG